MLFDNARDAAMRLEGTIVSYDGKAFKVLGITGEDIRLYGVIIRNGTEVTCHQDDPLLSMAPPPIGYVNFDNHSLYLMRKPVRRWKQGLDIRALACPGAGMRIMAGLGDRNLMDCLENVYPSFEKSLGMFKSTNPFNPDARKSVAFSRYFCVNKGAEGLCLEYKGRAVGVVEKGVPVLSEKFQWLREGLEETINA